MLAEIIAIYAITDDLLKALGHQEDSRTQLSDAEVVTIALVAARCFGGNHQMVQDYLKEQGLMPQILSKSRFNRRLHRLFLPLLDVFDCLGTILKSLTSALLTATVYTQAIEFSEATIASPPSPQH